jgi:small subunit ribosomal protein S20
MPNTSSAKKALRQTKKRTQLNIEIKDTYKKAIKVANKVIDTGKDAKEEIRLAQKTLDKAAKKGVIKKNTAARKLSRLTAKSKKVAK